MDTHLHVFRAKPNPVGKDKTSGGSPKPEQLLGEWVDIKNIGTESIPFSRMELFHTLYDNQCQPTGRTEKYWFGSSASVLKPGQVLRVHTGRGSDEAVMRTEDRGTVDWRAFAESGNFVLNNACGDVIKIVWTDSAGNRWSDSAAYRPSPPEGVILTRVGNMLVSSMAATY